MPEIAEDRCFEKLDVAIRSLVYVLSSRDGLMREFVRRSLVTIGEPTVGMLMEALGDSSKTVRWEAAKALGEIGSPRAAPVLVEALEDGFYDVRWLAAEGLIVLGRQALKPLLEALTRYPESGWLCEGAHHVLRSFSDPQLDDLVEPLVIALGDLTAAADIIPRTKVLLDALNRERRE